VDVMGRPKDSTTATVRSDRATLPAERAFVVQLRADADLARGIVRGRLEHLTTGAAAVFESLDELIRCMRDAMAPRPATRPDAGGSDGTAPERRK
jgi:hypothetical protein